MPETDANVKPALGRRAVFRRTALQAAALMLMALAAALVSAGMRPPSTTPAAREITLAQVRATFASETILWVDARPAAAFTDKHIPGAVWLAEEAWEEGLPNFVQAWTPGQPVIVYCGSLECGASRSVARRLAQEFNVTRVYHLKGGWAAWQKGSP